MSEKIHFPQGPLEAEAKPLEEAVDFAWDVGIWDAHFECDSQLGLTSPQVTIINIIAGICDRVQVFRLVQVSHIKREGNRPTHILAQFAKGIDNYVTWIKENLNIIESVVAQDVLNLSSS